MYIVIFLLFNFVYQFELMLVYIHYFLVKLIQESVSIKYNRPYRGYYVALID